MHHPTERIAHTTAFVTPVVEHWLWTRNSSSGPPHEGSIRRPIVPWAKDLTTELHLALSQNKTERYFYLSSGDVRGKTYNIKTGQNGVQEDIYNKKGNNMYIQSEVLALLPRKTNIWFKGVPWSHCWNSEHKHDFSHNWNFLNAIKFTTVISFNNKSKLIYYYYYYYYYYCYYYYCYYCYYYCYYYYYYYYYYYKINLSEQTNLYTHAHTQIRGCCG